MHVSYVHNIKLYELTRQTAISHTIVISLIEQMRYADIVEFI